MKLKVLKYNSKNSLKILNMFLNKRKFIQKNKAKAVSQIIQNVKWITIYYIKN